MRTTEEYIQLAENQLAKGAAYAPEAQVYATLALVAHGIESDQDYDDQAAEAAEQAELDRAAAVEDRAAAADLLRLARMRLEEEEAYRKTLG